MNKLIFEFRVGPFYSDEFSCDGDFESVSNERKDGDWSIANIFGVFRNRQPVKPSWAYRATQSQVCVSPSGSRVAFIQRGTLTVCSFMTEEEHSFELSQKFRIHPQSRRLKWSPDEESVMVLSNDGTLLLLSRRCEYIGTVDSSALSDQGLCKVQHMLPIPREQGSPVTKCLDSLSFDMHLVCSTGEVATVTLCHKISAAGNEVHVEVQCRHTIPKFGSGGVDVAAYLPRRSMLLLISSPSADRCQLHCLRFDKEKYALEAVPNFLSSPYVKCACPDVAPFLDFSFDPFERAVALLHASGRCTLLAIQNSSTMRIVDELAVIPAAVGFAQSPSEADTGETFCSLRPSRVTSVHFLGERSLLAMTNEGDVCVCDVFTEGECSNENCFQPSAVDVLPPCLGPAVSDAIILTTSAEDETSRGADGLLSRVCFLRAIDSWTSQVFTLSPVTSRRALHTKIREGSFAAAYELAERIGENSDVVALAEWRYHLFEDAAVPLPAAQGALLSRCSAVDIFLRKVRSDWLVLDEVTTFESADADVWTAVLEEGLRRTTAAAEATRCAVERHAPKHNNYTWGDSDMTGLLDELQDVLSDQEVSRGDLSLESVRKLMTYRRQIVNKLLKVSCYLLLREFGVDLHELCRNVPREPHGHESFAGDATVIAFMRCRLLRIAEYLASRCLISELKTMLSLHPRELMPHLLSLLSAIPVTCSPDLYACLFPIPSDVIVNAAAENTLFLQGIWSVYTLGGTGAEQRSAVMIVDPYENDQSTPMLPLPIIGAGDVSCWPVVSSRVAALEDFKADVNPDVLSRKHIVRMVLDRVWEIERFGQSSCSLEFISVAVAALLYKFNRSSNKQEASCDLVLIEELQIHLTHFCALLYSRHVDPSLSFAEWCFLSAPEKVHHSIKSHVRLRRNDLATFIKRSLKPMLEGQGSLFSRSDRGTFLDMVSARGGYAPPAELDMPRCQSAEEIIVEELINLITSDYELKNGTMEGICEVAEASLHVKKPGERCLTNIQNLMTLVTRGCQAYDDMENGLGYMWRLMETTPTSVGKNTAVTDALDAVESVLTAGEIIKSYLVDKPVPPMSVLLPTCSQHKVARRNFTKLLQAGAGRYAVGLDYLMVQSASATTCPEWTKCVFELEHAVVMSICEAMCSKIGTTDEMWNKMMIDVTELKNRVFPKLPLCWAGAVCLQAMLKAKCTGTFMDAAEYICAWAEEGRGGSDEYMSVGKTLVRMGLSAVDVSGLITRTAQEALNSASSCFDEEVIEARELVSMIPINNAVEERGLLGVVNFISLLDADKVDFIPLQLRLKHPVDVAQEILAALPEAYCKLEDGSELMQEEQPDEIQSPSIYGKEDDEDGYENEDDALMRQYRLSERTQPGDFFIRTLLQLPLGGSGFDVVVGLHMEVIKAAIARGTISDAIEVFNAILSRSECEVGFDSTMATTISDTLSLLLDAASKVPRDERIGESSSRIKESLCLSLLSKCPLTELMSACDLWTATRHETNYIHVDANGAQRERGLFDEVYLEYSRDLLLRIVGDILQKPCGSGHTRDPLLPVHEIVSSASTTTCSSALMGHLLLVDDTAAVDEMFSSVLRDLKLKISRSITAKSKKARPSDGVVPDESLVNLIENMGFSRNGAKRAVMATRNESMEAALSWAIHHSNEEGWDDPVTSAHAVCGALLPEEFFPTISLEDLNEAVKVVARISKEYNKAVGKIAVKKDTEKKNTTERVDHASHKDPTDEPPPVHGTPPQGKCAAVIDSTAAAFAVDKSSRPVVESDISVSPPRELTLDSSHGNSSVQCSDVNTSIDEVVGEQLASSIAAGCRTAENDIELDIAEGPDVDDLPDSFIPDSPEPSSPQHLEEIVNHFSINDERDYALSVAQDTTGAPSAPDTTVSTSYCEPLPLKDPAVAALDPPHCLLARSSCAADAAECAESPSVDIRSPCTASVSISTQVEYHHDEDEHDVFVRVAEATVSVSRLEGVLNEAEEIVHCGINPLELAKGVIFSDPNLEGVLLEDEGRDSGVRTAASTGVQEDLAAILGAVATHRHPAAFPIIFAVVHDVPSQIAEAVGIILENSRPPNLVQLVDVVSSLKPSAEPLFCSEYDDIESSSTDRLTVLLGERRFMTLFAGQPASSASKFSDGGNTAGAPASAADLSDESLRTLFRAFHPSPLRLFFLLRAAYMQSRGTNASALENIKRAAMELLSYDGFASGDKCEVSPRMIAKQQLQEDIATLRRIRRVPLPGAEASPVDVKKLLQSDEILPATFFTSQSNISPRICRLTAMNELMSHLSAENISQWNRAIGRLLDTGPSELGLYFGISQLLDISTHTTASGEDFTAHVNHLLIDIVPLMAKMRGEHVRAFCLAVLGMDPRQAGVDLLPYKSSSYEPDDEKSYDLGIGAETAEQLLTGVLNALKQTSHAATDITKPAARTKTKSLLAKPSDADSAGGDREKLIRVVESLLAFNVLLKTLPASMHALVRMSYTQREQALELVLTCVRSGAVDEKELMACVQILDNHCQSHFQKPLEPVSVIDEVVLCNLKGQFPSTCYDCPLFLQKCAALVGGYGTGNERFDEYAFSALASSSPAAENREGALTMFTNRIDMATALCDLYPDNSRADSILCFLRTNIYLMSEEVWAAVQFPFAGLDAPHEEDVVLPWPYECFSTLKHQMSVGKRAIDFLKHRLSVAAPHPEGATTTTGAMIKLFRMWTAVRTGRQATLEHFIAHLTAGYPRDDHSVSWPGDDNDVGVEDCYMSLLYLCALSADEEGFLDIVVGDLLCSSVWISKIDDIIALSSAFPRMAYRVTMQIFLLSFRSSLSGHVNRGDLDVIEQSLCALEGLCADDDIPNLAIASIMLCGLPGAIYTSRPRLVQSLVRRVFLWTENRIDTGVSNSEQTHCYDFSMSSDTFAGFLSALDKPGKCTVLPYRLSPMALVLALVRDNKIAEAAYVHWQVLSMPMALYRGDAACELLTHHISTTYPQLPFYFSCMPEVNGGLWGWTEWSSDIALWQRS